MNRTFHSRVDFCYGLLMALTAFALLDFFWFHHYIPALAAAAAMIFEIEMLVHTQYVLTSDGSVRIESGRFLRSVAFPVTAIERVRPVRSFKLAPALSVRRLDIVYRSAEEQRSVCISPRHAEEFLRCLHRLKEQAGAAVGKEVRS